MNNILIIEDEPHTAQILSEIIVQVRPDSAAAGGNGTADTHTMVFPVVAGAPRAGYRDVLAGTDVGAHGPDYSRRSHVDAHVATAPRAPGAVQVNASAPRPVPAFDQYAAMAASRTRSAYADSVFWGDNPISFWDNFAAPAGG